MKKIIFLEGLPGVGKTTLINYIKNLNLPNVHVVEELAYKNKYIIGDKDQSYYFKNDEMKYYEYNDGIIIIDRGFLSTLSYNQTKTIINSEHSSQETIKWFEKYKNIYQDDNVLIFYLTNKQSDFCLRYTDDNDSYGNIENQKLLESITLFNIKKYCKNYTIKEYYKENMEELVNEIIN